MKARNMALCALFAALLAICSWIALPVGDTVFTLQVFGVFLSLGVLGGKRGLVAILVYLLLGAVGLPVFSGFRGGIGALLDVNGGYLWGFLPAAAAYWLLTGARTQHPGRQLSAMVIGLAISYSCGCIWFQLSYLQQSTALWAVLLKMVVPYLLPDICKLLGAWYLSQKLRAYIP